MQKRKPLFLAIAAFTVLTSTSITLAATQGTAGTTSSGSSTVTLRKLSNVQVSSIDDIDLGEHAFLAAPATGTDQICVFSSNTAYQITFDQSGGNFELVGANTADTIPYTVLFTGIGVPATATAGTAITGQVGNPIDTSCLGVPNANYVVSVAAADFNASEPDNYSALLEILVEPE